MKAEISDTDRNKIINHWRNICTNKYGVGDYCFKTREIWRKITNTINEIISVACDLNLDVPTITSCIDAVVADEPKWIPNSNQVEGEMRREARKRKLENVNVNQDMEEAQNISIARARKRTEIEQTYGTKIRDKMESDYYFLHPNICFLDDEKKQRAPLAYWFFYTALIRQDKDAVDILKKYEEKNIGEANTKCDT